MRSHIAARLSRVRASFLIACVLCATALAAGSGPRPPVAVFQVPEEHPHVRSSFDLVLVHRRYVSHIVHEVRGGTPVVTLILTHGPNYWAFHARSHALHAPCAASGDCLQLMKRIDSHLRAGSTLGLSLDGSFVKRILFFGPPPPS